MKKDPSAPLLRVKEIRFCYFYLNYLKQHNCAVFLQNNGDDINDLNEQINSVIHRAKIDDKRQFVMCMKEAALAKLLPVKEFKWIKDGGNRCINWAWAYITVQQGTGQTTDFSLKYSSMGLKSQPVNETERFEEIIRFFDGYGVLVQAQLLCLQSMRSAWLSIDGGSRKPPFTWLDASDEEQCKWAWAYFASYGQREALFSCPPIQAFQPLNLKETYAFLYASFDVWNVTVETKKLFLINFNKAWHQKKHRDSMKGKKACSFVLHEDVKAQLDALAKKSGIKKNAYLEKIIKQEHEKLKA